MVNKNIKKESKVLKVAEGAFQGVGKVVGSTEERFEKTVNPIRENVLKKFPVLFLLTVTFGVIATFTGMEQIMLSVPLFKDNPWFILGIGMLILILTGTLYKKLNSTLD